MDFRDEKYYNVLVLLKFYIVEMPNRLRPSDQGHHQEWLKDTSVNGQPSGDLALEIGFKDNDPNGYWSTHLLRPVQDGWDRRLTREQETAIIIQGLSSYIKGVIATLWNNFRVSFGGEQGRFLEGFGT